MSTTSLPLSTIYRNLGACLELFLTAKGPLEKEIWRKESNAQLIELSAYTGEVTTVENFTENWFDSEFFDRLCD